MPLYLNHSSYSSKKLQCNLVECFNNKEMLLFFQVGVKGAQMNERFLSVHSIWQKWVEGWKKDIARISGEGFLRETMIASWVQLTATAASSAAWPSLDSLQTLNEQTFGKSLTDSFENSFSVEPRGLHLASQRIAMTCQITASSEIMIKEIRISSTWSRMGGDTGSWLRL